MSAVFATFRSIVAFTATILVAAMLSAAGAAAADKKSGPAWNDLKPEQRAVLAPLKERWDQDDAARKRKWIGVANRFSKMQPDEQARVKERMREWAMLTSEERRAARDMFREQRDLTPDKRQSVRDKWQEYQGLPEDRRRELSARPARTSTPEGGAASRN